MAHTQGKERLRFAMFGAGFWSHYQMLGWNETQEVECVALYNRTRRKAEELASRFGIPAVYDDPEKLLSQEKLDFVDICTGVETHLQFTRMAVEHGFPVVCQKPMADSLEEAEAMVRICRQANRPLYINENWRWQFQFRALKPIIDEGRIGRIFRVRIDYRNNFPLFENQPFLKEVERFILMDIGSHVLDTARYLFGDAESVYCRTSRVHPGIKGEDVATVVLGMESGATVTCDISYSTLRERDYFPQTLIEIEGEHGFIELAADYLIRETTPEGIRTVEPQLNGYPWGDPIYEPGHSSIVGAQRNIARAIKGLEPAETTGEDNLKTVRLVFGSYESAATGRVIDVREKRAGTPG